MSEQGPDRIVEPRRGDDSTSWQDASDSETWISQVLPGILAVAFVIIVALAVAAGERALMNSARQTNASTLQSVLSNTIQRFEAWAGHQEDHASIWLDHPDLIATIRGLEGLDSPEALADAQMQTDIRMRLDTRVAEYGYRGYELVDAGGRVLSAMEIGRLGQLSEALNTAGAQPDGIRLTAPRILDGPVSDQSGEEHSEISVIGLVIPLREPSGLVGYLIFEVDPMREYTSTFQVGRTGVSGDTYVVNRDGRLLSNSRYDAQFVEAGLLSEGHPSMLHLDARDPGMTLRSVSSSVRPYSEWPLTYAARDVTAGNAGQNLDGYRDPRGVLVMGAWQWSDERDFGVITEIELSEALAGASQAQAVLRVFAVAMALSFILLAVLFSAHRNISRQRAAATHEARQRLSQILMSAGEGIYGIDGDGKISFINRSACEMLGYSEDELVGRPAHATIHHSNRDGSIYPLQECPVHTAGVPIIDNDKEVFWTKSGQPIPIEYSTTAIKTDDVSAGAVVTFRDITKRRQDEQALRRYAQELKRSNAELQEFAYAASHDLQEPLRKIQAFGDRLSNKYGAEFDDTGRHYLERMVDAAGRMRQLIDDLLSYSRVNSKTTSFLPVELSAVVADVVSDLEPRIASEGAKIRVGELPAIEADPGQMHQLFINLIANALKFRRSGIQPSISIEGSVEVGDAGAVARIAVADNGIGFEPRHAERIFGMFERLHGREEYDGTGVGLATCRKIAERHSGELTAWGEPDAGAVFTLTLPIRQGGGI
ncbi:ATP-binding protein [Maricaulis sp.]|uniref:sensor histidine kinase n=1 Tax=Maricaulis sp. TaxID=1486257 RepID=UPI0026181C93|nr:ATP-binding protein [Maricaulis sp.]